MGVVVPDMRGCWAENSKFKIQISRRGLESGVVEFSGLGMMGV
jgi:hypothetical protein